MKFSVRRFLKALCALLILAALPVLAGRAAAGEAPEGPAAGSVAGPAAERPVFGIAMPSFRESRWQYDIQSLENQAARLDVDILVRFAGNDQGQQNIQIKELTNLGVDVLIIAPSDAYTASEAVTYAKGEGIPVVSYDRLLMNCPVDAYIAFESRDVGALMGRFLAEAAPRGNYVLIKGPASDPNALEFFGGAMDVLRPLIDSRAIRVIEEGEATEWRADAARRIVEAALKKNSAIAAVLAPNDDTAGGAIEALAAAGLAGKTPVTGQDANAGGLDRVLRGLQGMTIFKDTNLIAARAMRVALMLHEGKTRPEGGSPGGGNSPNALVENGAGKVPAYLLPVMPVEKSGLRWLLKMMDR